MNKLSLIMLDFMKLWMEDLLVNILKFTQGILMSTVKVMILQKETNV